MSCRAEARRLRRLVAHTKEIEGSNINQHSVRIALTSELNPFFLSTFLNSRFGKLQSDSNIVGVTRPALDYETIKNFIIPNTSAAFQDNIESIITLSGKYESLSQNQAADAEHILLKELKLDNWKPQRKLSYIKNFSKAVEANRIDAEYFQPQYDDIISHVKAHNNMPLGDIVDYSKGVEVGSEEYIDEGVGFVRVSDFSVRGFETAEKKISHELAAKLQGKYSSKKDDILFTKDGTIGITWVNDEDNKAVLSGAFLILKPKIEIDREYLALVLNSIICSKQIEMLSGGALIAHLFSANAKKLLAMPEPRI